MLHSHRQTPYMRVASSVLGGHGAPHSVGEVPSKSEQYAHPQVPAFNAMYELYDPCTIMFFFRNKHIMIDLGTGNNNKINWAMTDKQEFIDIVEVVYRGARKGRGLVVSPKGACWSSFDVLLFFCCCCFLLPFRVDVGCKLHERTHRVAARAQYY